MWMVKRQRQKYKQLQSIYNLMHGLEQVLKDVMQKQMNVNGSKLHKCFYIKKVLYNIATILQHYDFVLLSKHILIM